MEDKEIQKSLHIAELISGYLLNDLEISALDELEQWVNTSAANMEIFKSVLNESDLTRMGLTYTSADVNSALYEAKKELEFSKVSLKPTGSYSLKVWKRSWFRAVAAVVVLGTMSLGIWRYTSQSSVGHNNLGAMGYQNDVKPGKHTATLTLANGEVVDLNQSKTGIAVNASKLTYNDNTLVDVKHKSVTEKNEYLTATTPRGGTYQIILPDGTKVWLNAASSLKFPSTFNGLMNRKVELKGEAYFEVAKAYATASGTLINTPSGTKAGHTLKRLPFMVVTGQQEVEVLGTHFNINGYEDEENIKTTLLEGSVSVRLLKGQNNQAMILKPDQQSLLSSDHLNIREVSADEVVAWKDGDFRFRNEDLKSIMKQLSRWYDVTVEYKGDFNGLAFGGVVSRSKNISAVLEIMESTKKVKFKIEGKKVIVEKI